MDAPPTNEKWALCMWNGNGPGSEGTKVETELVRAPCFCVFCNFLSTSWSAWWNTSIRGHSVRLVVNFSFVLIQQASNWRERKLICDFLMLPVYVGLYGYEYWTASSKVYQLFQARGWSLILNDHLVGRSLALMQLLIGVVCSGIGIVLGLVFVGSPVAGLLLGFVLSTRPKKDNSSPSQAELGGELFLFYF